MTRIHALNSRIIRFRRASSDPAALKILGFDPFRGENNRFNQTFYNGTGPHQNLSMDTNKNSYGTGLESKIDHSFSDKHKIFGRYSNARHRSTGPLAGRDANNFQPRIGVAYNFRQNWVFRGGLAFNTLDLWTNGLRENFDEYLATAVIQPPPGDPGIAFRLSHPSHLAGY